MDCLRRALVVFCLFCVVVTSSCGGASGEVELSAGEAQSIQEDALGGSTPRREVKPAEVPTAWRGLLQPAGVIEIDGDHQFVGTGIRGGDGSPERPFVISNLAMSGAFPFCASNTVLGHLIRVRNTTKHFVIRDSFLACAETGIELENVQNATVERNVISAMIGKTGMIGGGAGGPGRGVRISGARSRNIALRDNSVSFIYGGAGGAPTVNGVGLGRTVNGGDGGYAAAIEVDSASEVRIEGANSVAFVYGGAGGAGGAGMMGAGLTRPETRGGDAGAGGASVGVRLVNARRVQVAGASIRMVYSGAGGAGGAGGFDGGRGGDGGAVGLAAGVLALGGDELAVDRVHVVAVWGGASGIGGAGAAGTLQRGGDAGRSLAGGSAYGVLVAAVPGTTSRVALTNNTVEQLRGGAGAAGAAGGAQLVGGFPVGAGGFGAPGGAGGDAKAFAFEDVTSMTAAGARATREASAGGTASTTSVTAKVVLVVGANVVDQLHGAAGGAAGMSALPLAAPKALEGGAGGSAAAFAADVEVVVSRERLSQETQTSGLAAGLGGLGNQGGPRVDLNGATGRSAPVQLD